MKLIIFDADGTLTPQRPTSTSPAILELLPGRLEKITRLIETGIIVAIASNQSAKRLSFDIQDQLDWTIDQLGITPGLVWFETETSRKKPNPYMLNCIMQATGINPSYVLFVGDQETDQEAATRAGIKFAWANDFFS